MTCRECEMNLLDNAAFCSRCGCRVAGSRTADQNISANGSSATSKSHEARVGEWVFSAFSVLTLIVTFARGFIPTELCEAALWAVIAWLWHKKRTDNQSFKEVLIMFAILLAGGEGYLFGQHITKVNTTAPFAQYSTFPSPPAGQDGGSQPSLGAQTTNPPTQLSAIDNQPGSASQAKANSSHMIMVDPFERSFRNQKSKKGQAEERFNTRVVEPDLSKLNSSEESSIEEACFIPKSEGPAAYYQCLNLQLRKLPKAPSYPDLSQLSSTEESSIQQACFLAKSDGPASYNRCLTRQLKLLGIKPKTDGAFP